jgi:hypothetical protein
VQTAEIVPAAVSYENGATSHEHANHHANEPANGVTGEQTLFAHLLQQLAEKDRQLEAKDRQIEMLIEKQGRARPEFIDIGWGAFNVEALEVVGIWAEQNRPGEPVDPEVPRIRVFGESFTISQETLWHLYQVLNLPRDQSPTNDKFAAITNDDSCLNKAMLCEPLFILRAQDQFAADLVRQWADQVEQSGGGADKILGARIIAGQMEAWTYHKIPD